MLNSHANYWLVITALRWHTDRNHHLRPCVCIGKSCMAAEVRIWSFDVDSGRQKASITTKETFPGHTGAGTERERPVCAGLVCGVPEYGSNSLDGKLISLPARRRLKARRRPSGVALRVAWKAVRQRCP